MRDPRPQPIHRKDYRPPDFRITHVELAFDIRADTTTVSACLTVRREAGAQGRPLILDGEDLDLVSIAIDGEPLAPARFTADNRRLTIAETPDAFRLDTVVRLRPQDNTELSGLYRSGRTICTQCEAEGFRRITFFADRPDVMSVYTTTITADRAAYPVLLSNGNRVSAKDGDDGRHEVRWHDPFPKPSYLFALVAADIRCKRGAFTTASGRDVALEVWVEEANLGACDHALAALQKSMKWDEETYGLEYDLDVYMVVAVSDFNMAAMENKGLNIFNDKYVLARPETATDYDYENIEGVIAHEYFHNWTGNRVTCRDWFQLTLKEGLTVFRDEQFSADMTSHEVKRIQDVRLLRTAQFAEDASPTAHPIRPDSYIEMNNFYTVTVYSKGAEVVRMIHTLLGAAGFRKGMDLYFERHDGQAVTCDDFVSAMADATQTDLEQFRRWYAQAGTPRVVADGTYDAATRRYTLTLEQHAPEGVPTSEYRPMHIPVATGLVGDNGSDLAFSAVEPAGRCEGTTALLDLKEPKQTFVFADVDEPRAASLLRGFSAPVRLEVDHDEATRTFLMAHDADSFNRWDAAQQLSRDLLLRASDALAKGEAATLSVGFVEAFGRVLADAELSASLKALTLELPEERLLGQAQPVVDVDGVHAARAAAVLQLAKAHETAWWSTYRRLDQQGRPYQFSQGAVSARRLKNVALGYLVAGGSDEAIEAALAQFRGADNMTDAFAALAILCDTEHPACDIACDEFLSKWENDPLVVDKWFSAQASSSRSDTLDRVVRLTSHRLFSLGNPNRARSLLGVFSVRNQVRFHDRGGGGYALLGSKILELDDINPQVAARLVGAFTQWRRFDAQRQASMKEHLGAIVSTPGLSPDVYELASKCLGDDGS